MLRGTPIHPPPEEGFLARLSLRASIESIVYQITLYYTMLINIILHCIILYYTILNYTIPYYWGPGAPVLRGGSNKCTESDSHRETVSNKCTESESDRDTVLHYAILYVLYYTIRTILHYTILY